MKRAIRNWPINPQPTIRIEKKIVGIGYETVQLADATLSLLLPMSEVAGRLSIQAGAKSLEMRSGGKGILLPGVSGVRRGRVTIIGAGVVGLNGASSGSGSALM